VIFSYMTPSVNKSVENLAAWTQAVHPDGRIAASDTTQSPASTLAVDGASTSQK
jgi:hypothetical protein